MARIVNVAKMFVGTLLIAAGMLKLHELLLYRGGWVAVGSEASSLLSAAGILLELIAGFFFLVTQPQKALWWIGLAIVGVFAVYNLKQLADDKPSCVCFGVVSVSPWVSLFFDGVGMVMLLGTLREVPDTNWNEFLSLRGVARAATCAIALTAAHSGVEQTLYLSQVGARSFRSQS